jgi:hypothetical protein
MHDKGTRQLGLNQSPQNFSSPSRSPIEPSLRKVVAAQCRLLAARAEAGLPIDLRSVLNLLRAIANLQCVR